MRRFALAALAVLTLVIQVRAQQACDSLSIDGPYLIHCEEGARFIGVTACGTITDTTCRQIPASFKVCDHQGRFPFEVSLRPIRRQNWNFREEPGRCSCARRSGGRHQRNWNSCMAARVRYGTGDWCWTARDGIPSNPTP